MYKVSEVAQIVGVSTAAIYKELKRVDNKFTTIDNGKKRVTEDGLRYFQERYRVKGCRRPMMILCGHCLLSWKKKTGR